MIASRWRAALLMSGGLLLTMPLQATQSAAQSAPSHASRSATRATTRSRAIDPRALQAVRNMSAYLRTLSSFQVQATTNREEIDPRGQKVSYTGTIDYKVRRPNRFVVQSNEAGRQRKLVYDGKTLTLFTPNNGYYASVQAPPTIRDTLALAADRYDINPPLVELFKWNAGDVHERKITSARWVGPVVVNGQAADEYAFRGRARAWRIAIARGPRPVPLRIAVTGTDQPKRLTFTSNLAWNTDTQFAENTFAFQPPPGARQIGIASG
jgi:hypothetical protein